MCGRPAQNQGHWKARVILCGIMVSFHRKNIPRTLLFCMRFMWFSQTNIRDGFHGLFYSGFFFKSSNPPLLFMRWAFLEAVNWWERRQLLEEQKHCSVSWQNIPPKYKDEKLQLKKSTLCFGGGQVYYIGVCRCTTLVHLMSSQSGRCLGGTIISRRLGPRWEWVVSCYYRRPRPP